MKNFRWKLWVPCVVAAGAALVACSLLVPVQDQQCTTTSDCTSKGGSFAASICQDHVCVSALTGEDANVAYDPIWGCVTKPSEVTSQNVTVQVAISFFNAIDQIQTAAQVDGGSDLVAVSFAAVPGLAVEGCKALDPSCMSPVTPTEISDEAGVATLALPQNFDGYVQYEEDGEVPSRVYMGGLQPDASATSAVVAALGTDGLALLAAGLGVTEGTSEVGNVFFEVFDCEDHHQANVQFRTPSYVPGKNSVAWYADKNAIPSVAVNVTSPLGTGGIINVPVGSLTVIAELIDPEAGTDVLELGQTTVFVKENGATYAWFRVRTH